MEVAKLKCKCGWEGSVRVGKILAIYCPRCKTRLVVKEVKKVVEEVKKVEKKVKKRGRKRSSTV